MQAWAAWWHPGRDSHEERFHAGKMDSFRDVDMCEPRLGTRKRVLSCLQHNLSLVYICIWRCAYVCVYIYNICKCIYIYIYTYRKDCCGMYIMNENRRNKPYKSVFTSVLQYNATSAVSVFAR